MTLPTLIGSLLLAASLATPPQQASSWLGRDADGAVVCRIVAPTKSVDPGTDRLAIDIRVPGTPSALLTGRLPARSRNYSTLPISVYLVPAPLKNQTVSGKLPQIVPLLTDFSERRLGIDPDPTRDTFVRVEYARRSLVTGVDLVAERTAVADSGEKVVSQTRCRIRANDDQGWR